MTVADIVVLGDGGSNYRKSIDPEYKANRRERYAEQTGRRKEFEQFLAEFPITMILSKIRVILRLSMQE